MYIREERKNSTKLVKHTDGKWWYVKRKGVWQPKYKGIVKKSGKKYYVVKGKRVTRQVM